MSEHLEITYRARGGRMPVDLELHLGPGGQAEVYVGTSYSIPSTRVNRVGNFGGRAPTAEVNALGSYLDEHDLLTRGGSHGQATPDAPNRFLEIRSDGRDAQLTLSGLVADAAIAGFEDLLHGLALAMTNQPIGAVEASLDVRALDGQIAATIVLRAIGSEPMPALLVDTAQPGMTLRAEVGLQGKEALPSGATYSTPLGNTVLSPDAVRRMAEDGTLPGGVSEIPANASYRFELPPIAAPRSPDPVVGTGALTFWRPDGQARRVMTVLTQETPLPAS